MSAVTRAVVVASARSGSGWLCALLNAHPAVHFHGEIFNLEHAPLAAVQDPQRYLNDHLTADGAQHVVGFKILYHQARLAYLNELLIELDQGRTARLDWRRIFPLRPVTGDMAPGLAATWHALRQRGQVHIIHLRRRNLLRQHLSHQRLMFESRARWRAAPVHADIPIDLDAAHLVAHLERQEQAAAQIDAFFRTSPRLDVWYEELTADLARQCGRIFGFLGIPASVPLVPAAGRAQPSLRQAIRNYDAVAQALAGTHWAGLLEQG